MSDISCSLYAGAGTSGTDEIGVNRLRSWRDLKIALSKLISLAGPRKNGEQSSCQLEASLRDNGIIVAIEESPSQVPW